MSLHPENIKYLLITHNNSIPDPDHKLNINNNNASEDDLSKIHRLHRVTTSDKVLYRLWVSRSSLWSKPEFQTPPIANFLQNSRVHLYSLRSIKILLSQKSLKTFTTHFSTATLFMLFMLLQFGLMPLLPLFSYMCSLTNKKQLFEFWHTDGIMTLLSLFLKHYPYCLWLILLLPPLILNSFALMFTAVHRLPFTTPGYGIGISVIMITYSGGQSYSFPVTKLHN